MATNGKGYQATPAQRDWAARVLSDALMRDVDRDDVEAFLDYHGAGARAAEQFRAAERDARYSAAEEGRET
jgi:hypothetical protein